jgi:Zn-dependent protease
VKNVKICISPGAILFWIVQLTEGGVQASAGLLAALVHECGHLGAARLTRTPLGRMEIDVMGAKLFPAAQIRSYPAEGILAAAGPCASLLLLLPLSFCAGPFAESLRVATLSFAIFNLLPINGFDGGRALHALLAGTFSEKVAERVTFFTTYLSLLLLFSLSSCLLLRYGENASLAVLSAYLFAHLFLSLGHPETILKKK